MRASATIRALASHAGASLYDISRSLGHAPSWAGVTARSGREPAASTVAAVAGVCGCDLVIVDRETGERVATIDPPERG